MMTENYVLTDLLFGGVLYDAWHNGEICAWLYTKQFPYEPLTWLEIKRLEQKNGRKNSDNVTVYFKDGTKNIFRSSMSVKIEQC